MERVSTTVQNSRRTLERFGAVLDHNFEKLALFELPGRRSTVPAVRTAEGRPRS
ncbi:hypothetical protein [Kitasatospora sp. MAP5-34]|uniref:hypothetical protein n=1 Tax=Kitasatospora sp. MAP5-34 TaxID=3035102 RepID=UPI002474CFE5|nr:hypothetical protein [Kitasatospora sp. MAP5-34]MDH6580319.1 S-adenosylmethionine synthetase [Kitasatospora sp. MAP5-34]